MGVWWRDTGNAWFAWLCLDWRITRWVPTWLTALGGWEGSLSEAQWSEEDSCCKDQHRLWPQWVGVCVWLCECEWSLPGVGLEMLCSVASCPGEQGGPGLVQLWHRQAEAREYTNTMFNKLACAWLTCSLPLLFIHLFFVTHLVGSYFSNQGSNLCTL